MRLLEDLHNRAALAFCADDNKRISRRQVTSSGSR